MKKLKVVKNARTRTVKNKGIVRIEEIENKIIELKGQKVILDSAVAGLYNVSTKEVNQAVSNNPDKFPQNYVFELTREEKADVVKNFDHLDKIKYSPHLPKAFTEKGLYMLATILKGDKAVQTTISIIETFAKLRKLTRNIKALSVTGDKSAQKALMRESGGLAAEIFDEGLETIGSETSIEVNFAVLKLKHIIKRKKQK